VRYRAILKKLLVHWHFLTSMATYQPCALTEFLFSSTDGNSRKEFGAVGGLLTARTKMGKGMKRSNGSAEAFIFENWHLSLQSCFLTRINPFYDAEVTTIHTPVTLGIDSITLPISHDTEGQPEVSASVYHFQTASSSKLTFNPA